MLVTESAVSQLDDLLERIGVKLQISPTAHKQAKKRYKTIGAWLGAEGSPLAQYEPWIYSQGSLKIGTTVKPIGRNEYDLDLVCEFQMDWRLFPEPVKLLDIVWDRLYSNETYRPMIERMNRCIRINYANEFHMDILPACPKPEAGLHCVVVPDCDAEDWKDSNPKGYALWFEAKAKQALAEFKRKNAEPLPEQQTFEELEPLKRAVQLMKRHRDVVFEKTSKLAPISIVLTTLAADHYQGQSSVNEALRGILDGIMASIPKNERLYILNPTNPREDLSERWDDHPERYRAFVNFIRDFRNRWGKLNEQRGIQNIKVVLENMFGESIAKEVITEHIKAFDMARADGGLGVRKGSGIIGSATSAASIPVQRNTFYGEEEE
jgi:hypothetical protein